MKSYDRLKLAVRLAFGRIKQADMEPGGILAGLISNKGGSFAHRNTEQLLNAFNFSPWVRACACKVADSLASVQWRLFVARSRRSGKAVRGRDIRYLQRVNGPHHFANLMKRAMPDHELEEVNSHLLLDVLNQANREMTGLELRWLMSIWLDLVGDAFFIKERGPLKAPVALWPVPPHWVVETPTSKRPMFRIAYRSWHILIPQEDMLWMRYRNPVMPYNRGSGIAGSLDDEISIHEHAGKHMMAFFRNSGRPDILVMPKEGGLLGEHERDRLENWWTDQLQGFWRRYKPLFLTRPLDVKLIEQKFRDMQLTEIRKSESDIIMQTFGIPPELFGRLEHSNKATIEKAMEIFASTTLVPRLERKRETLQAFLIPEYDEKLVLTYDSPVPSDKAFTLSVYKAQPNAFLLNEIRALGGAPPIDDLEGQYGVARASSQRGSGTDGKQYELDLLNDDELKEFHQLMRKIS